MRNPYITGPYVSGTRHYGRAALIDGLLHGDSPAYWVVGNRRTGKTSLLRQLEHLAQDDERFVPVYWDLQGSHTVADLGEYLAAATVEAAEQLKPLGLGPSAADTTDVLALLARLRRVARKAGRELLLLCDETEVLVDIARRAPKSLQRLRSELTSGNGLRVVAVSTQAIYHLYDLCRDWPTSTFLAGFDVSHALGSLSTADAHQLVLQAQAPQPVRAAPEVVEQVCEQTNQHPYLLQVLCARLFQDDGTLRPVEDADLEPGPNLQGHLQTDYYMLSPADCQIVQAVAEAGTMADPALASLVGGSAAELQLRLRNLERLGYLRRRSGQVRVGNALLARWLTTAPRRPRVPVVASQRGPDGPGVAGAGTPGPSETAMRAALADQQSQQISLLVAELNHTRSRLVELEAVRARDLLDVSPRVLVEIDDLQASITRLRRLVPEGEPGDAAVLAPDGCAG